MDAFGRMIQRALDSHDPPWGAREAARRCGLSSTQIIKFINQDLQRMPRKDTLVKISQGLKIPMTEVVIAANEALGLPIDPATTMGDYEKIHSLSKLSKKDKDVLYAQFEYMMHQLEKQERNNL